MKLDLFQCEIEFVPMWNWICSNVKLDLFQCEIGFVQMWNWICSNVKLDAFQCEMGFGVGWPKNQLSISNGLGVMMFWRSGGKGAVNPWMNEWRSSL